MARRMTRMQQKAMFAKKKVVWPTGTAEVKGGFLHYKGKPVYDYKTPKGHSYQFKDGKFAMTMTAHASLKRDLQPFKTRKGAW